MTGVLLPASALFLDRPMPPARALVDAGAAVALATDFNPGSAFCESLPLVCSLACTQLHLSPAEALSACTVNAAHVLRRADRKGRLAPGYDADLVLLDAPDWRYLAYHLGGPVVTRVVGGERGRWRVATKKQAGAARKGRRHEYEYVYVDDTGQEVSRRRAEPAPEEKPVASGQKPSGQKAKTGSAKSGTPRRRILRLPSGQARRGAIFAPFILVSCSSSGQRATRWSPCSCGSALRRRRHPADVRGRLVHLPAYQARRPGTPKR